MQHELLGDCQDYEEETIEEYTLRYSGSYKDIYLRIEKELPQIFKYLKLYKAVRNTGKCVGQYPFIEDSYAIFDNGNISFSIQLDALGEVLCIWNFETVFEIGYWSDEKDKLGCAIKFIEKTYIK